MSIILEPRTMADLHNLPEHHPKHIALVRIVETNQCYITPLDALQSYRMIRDSVSTQRADAVLGVMKDPRSTIRMVDDGDLIDLAIAAADCGVPLAIAFSAALAVKMDAQVLTNEEVFIPLEEAGFCVIRRY